LVLIGGGIRTHCHIGHKSFERNIGIYPSQIGILAQDAIVGALLPAGCYVMKCLDFLRPRRYFSLNNLRPWETRILCELLKNSMIHLEPYLPHDSFDITAEITTLYYGNQPYLIGTFKGI